ncbi:hypothetical protein C0993_009828 [Termitomyces sp. T159_Od127]|nr:hypothetical protein C0993_009828 [Termitomyces sp. T159_Od127]
MIKEEGEEHAVNAAIEGALWGITRNKEDGTFEISERGPAVENVATQLAIWLKKYPQSVILNKRVEKALGSTKIVFQKYNKPKAKKKGFLGKKSKAAIPKKQDSKIFTDIKDDRYNDQPEKVDGRQGQEIVHRAIQILAGSSPAYLKELEGAVGISSVSTGKQPRGELVLNSNQPPPLKRVKSLFEIGSHGPSASSISADRSKIKPLEPMEKKSVGASSLHEGRKKLKKEGDDALVELVNTSCQQSIL